MQHVPLCFAVLAVLAQNGFLHAQVDTLRFDRDIRPILSDKCYYCHGPDTEHREADLRLDLEEAAKESVLVPGSAADSELIRRLLSTDPDEVMPPPASKKEMSDAERQLLMRWIDEGAVWSQHWSFEPPTLPELPDLELPNPIDRFVLRELRAQGKSFSREASRSTLIRRLTFDLTGLPPTLQEVDDFLSDTSDNALERVVDRLLASPHYGERMGLMWLDAARYGDTSVFHADGPRDMWGWRDAVVDAYNANMPFDEFSIAQLAGDLLPEATLQQKILSAFNRNNGTTDEGGAIAEEYRVEYAVDRVKTTSMVWMGLTLECAQCHDHKYDPISHEDYYSFYAFFNISDDAGMQTRDGNATPLLEIPDPQREAQLPAAESQLADLQTQLAALANQAEPQFQQWLLEQTTTASSLASPPVTPLLSIPFQEGKGRHIAAALQPKEAAPAASTEPEPADTQSENPTEISPSQKSDNTITGKLTGKVEWVETPNGKGLNFSGNNFVDFGDVADFERSDAFSYGGWIKPSSGVGAALARMDDQNAYRGYDLYVGASSISVHIIHAWPQNAIKVTTKKKLEAGQWYHVFATYDGSSSAAGVKIYVNGDEWEWEIEQDALSGSIQTTKSLLVGSRHPGSRFRGEIELLEVYDFCLSPAAVRGRALAGSVDSLLAIPAVERTPQQIETLRQHYLHELAPGYVDLEEQIGQQLSQIEELKQPLTSVMVMGDMQSPRETFILKRGAYDAPSEHRVTARTPQILPAMQEDAPRNRLGLAQWMFSPQNPLTARVTVNRYWQLLFGTGLVSTPEDFGAQGEFPSHPELLDWLAVDFQQHGWDIKRTLKQMVMSQTYRQTSHATVADFERDPRNRQLARAARFRLQGEFIRDGVLSMSGLLNTTQGGPGVKPYQPAGLWAEVGLGGNPKFVQDHGEKLYRRSLYTYWKRSAPPPSMQIFDAPTREKCTIRRARTNTPLQALVVLNDPQFVEAARHFAERVLSKPDASSVERLTEAFRIATSRFPSESELRTLLSVLQTMRDQFAQSPQDASELLGVGETSNDTQLEIGELASWTMTMSVLLNLDETLMRE
ncbi:DUF1553 domain-containing protein [Aureliella helgolandensis]|uniref:Planctomycete cytochrome C n=1 Tax=Aureliella helgolandensis TaxID=2527968 RepID=A0A518G622_9BACT|nr:DUF1553 domain-containing protein [Aureliella helgolandensis]QDV24040.1 Planctomycete cytochrome C [Aureliella helgolandensis]